MTPLQILRAGINKLPRQTSKEKREIQKNLTKCKSISVLNLNKQSTRTPSEALYCMFGWCKSEQGHDYWENIARELGEVKL